MPGAAWTQPAIHIMTGSRRMKPTTNSVRITVRVQPRASANSVLGFTADGTLRLRVTAPPVDGAANEAVCSLLAKTLGVPRSGVHVTHGKTGRRKVIQVDGLSHAEVIGRLSG